MKRKTNKEILFLVRSAGKGDDKSKYQILEYFTPLIKSSIKKYCPVWNEYEDLYQDGIFIVLECIEFYNEEKGEFPALVNSHLKYYYLETMKYIASKNGDVSTTDENRDIVDLVADHFVVEEEMLYRESVEDLKNKLLNLTERQLEIIILYYYFRLSHDDIAERLDISKWTVVNTKRAALNKLRGLYGECK